MKWTVSQLAWKKNHEKKMGQRNETELKRYKKNSNVNERMAATQKSI